MTTVQLAFDISSDPIYRWENYYISASNSDAVTWLRQWQKWPCGMLCIQGPSHSGKTHLSQLWRHESQAQILDFNTISIVDMLAKITNHPFALIEDIDKVKDQHQLLAVYNIIKENQGYLLITSLKPLIELPFMLMDLTSRLKTIPSAIIHEPDDELMRAILVKRFSDLQLRIPANVLDYLITHSERSYENIDFIIQELNKQSLQSKRTLTLPFIREILKI